MHGFRHGADDDGDAGFAGAGRLILTGSRAKPCSAERSQRGGQPDAESLRRRFARTEIARTWIAWTWIERIWAARPFVTWA
jgi:hypothetical protein